jgi:hypothetical protein
MEEDADVDNDDLFDERRLDGCGADDNAGEEEDALMMSGLGKYIDRAEGAVGGGGGRVGADSENGGRGLSRVPSGMFINSASPTKAASAGGGGRGGGREEGSGGGEGMIFRRTLRRVDRMQGAGRGMGGGRRGMKGGVFEVPKGALL